MSKVYRTARGQMLDIDKIKLANETTVAVGNMRVNARGDLLGPGGQVAQGRNQVMDQVYAVEPPPYEATAAAPVVQASRGKDLVDLTNNLVVPTPTAEVEETVNEDDTPEVVPAARGSLANSLAKETGVLQEPLPRPTKKSNGPQRF